MRLETRFYGPLMVHIHGPYCSIWHERHLPENMAKTGGICPVCHGNAEALRRKAK